MLTYCVRRLMRHLAMADGGAPEPLTSTPLERFVCLRSEREGFWHPGVAVGEAVKAGQELGRITDYEDRVLFIVSSLAINDNDPLSAEGA